MNYDASRWGIYVPTVDGRGERLIVNDARYVSRCTRDATMIGGGDR